MRKRALFIPLALLILGAIAYYYINNVFLPVHFKDFLEQRIEKSLNHDVSVGSISADPIHGFLLKDVLIWDTQSTQQYLIKIPQVSLKVLFLPFLKNKSLVIPVIKLYNPTINLSRNKQGVWNLSELSIKKDNNKQLGIFLRKIVIHNGSIILNDNLHDTPLQETFTHLNFQASVSIDKTLKFTGSVETTQKPSSLKTYGIFDIVNKDFASKITLKNVSLSPYLPLLDESPSFQIQDGFFSSQNLNLVFKDGKWGLSGDITADNLQLNLSKINQPQNFAAPAPTLTSLGGNIQLLNLAAVWEKNKLNLRGQLNSQLIDVRFPHNQTLRSQIEATIDELNFSDGILNVDGQLKTSQSLFKIGDPNTLQSDLSWPQINITWKDNTWTVKGNGQFNNTKGTLAGNNSLSGSFDVDGLNLVTHAEQSNITFNALANNFKMSIPSVLSAEGIFKAENASIDFNPQTLELSSKFILNEGHIETINGITITGHPLLNLTLKKNLADNSPAGYSATIRLTGESIANLPYINTAQNVSGEIVLGNNFLRTDHLNLTTLGSEVTLQGSLSNFKDPSLDIKISSGSIDAALISDFVPFLKNKLRVKLSGSTSIAATFQGKPSLPKEAVIHTELELSNVTAQGGKLKNPVTQISGKIKYTQDHIEWTDLSGKIQNKTYVFNGQLNNFTLPALSTLISSSNLKANISMDIRREYCTISRFKGKFFNTTFDSFGAVRSRKSGSPRYSLRGSFNLDLSDLKNVFKSQKRQLEPMNLQGTVTGKGVFAGSLDEWRNWSTSFEASSRQLNISGFEFENVSLSYAQRDNNINKFNIVSNFYNGPLNLQASANLEEKDIAVKINGSFHDSGFQQFRKSLGVKKPWTGKLSANLTLDGFLLKKGGIKGLASFSLKDGMLGQLIPQFPEAVFTEASANFSILNRKFMTKNMKIVSAPINLNGKGWIDFDQKLNMQFVPQFLKHRSMGSNPFPVEASTILAKAIRINVAGTIKTPQYTVEKSSARIIGNTTGVIGHGIGNIIDGIIDEF